MSKAPDLDSFGEIYPGFARHRALLKSRVPDATGLWERAFEVMRRTDSFYQRSDEDVARETMRVLIEALPPYGGHVRRKPK